jgi:hypothetical protein
LLSILLENENFDTKDFSIFISRKKWISSILRPLLELCAKEDSKLAMHCCSLTLVLIKKVSDLTNKKIKQLLKTGKKGSGSKTSTTAIGDGGAGGGVGGAITLHSDADSEIEDKGNVLKNYKEQILALLSFKEALCSG